MINYNKIVPIQKCDFLSMVGLILNIAGVEYGILESDNGNGDFVVTDTGNRLADAPVVTLDFTAASGTVYFVADYAFGGFKINGSAVDVDAEIKADGITLYKAVLDDGTITVDAVTPIGNEG